MEVSVSPISGANSHLNGIYYAAKKFGILENSLTLILARLAWTPETRPDPPGGLCSSLQALVSILSIDLCLK